THLDAYEDSLERAGLRPYTVGGQGYWSHQQVGDVCALLATIANPLDDRSLFGALASPACGVAPDTLWLLRAAAGRGRSVWGTIEHMTGSGGTQPAEPRWLEQISEPERELLRRFAATIGDLRRRAPFLPLAELIDAVVTETGYDLAVLMRPAGEARFSNVRKLMRLAAEFEAAEGRDLRGLLDFLAARAGADADPQAATAVEGHDGVRIMTVHSAKGLEFDVVAVPHLSRGLLSPARAPLLTIGHEAEEPRVGMQLRRLGAPTVKLYAHEELCGEAREREAEEELRLFHVAATRARERLILSGVVKAEPPRGANAGTPVVERIVAAFGIDREQDVTVPIPAPQAREGLDATFGSSQLAVRVNRASAARAAELAAVRKGEAAAVDLGEGPAPLLAARAPTAPSRPLSYTAIAAQSPERGRGFDPIGNENSTTGGMGTEVGVAVHALLEWSANNGWRKPPPELARRFALAADLDLDAGGSADELASPVRAWLASDLFREQVGPAGHSRAEVPLLLSVAGTVLRGSIDLLVERDGRPPLIVDYKTDRLDGADPAERAKRYEVQRDIYSLAASEALGVAEVEVAYVFLERPAQPVMRTVDAAELNAARRRLEARIEAIARTPAPA
ncbi:MAG TPA: 3'-5' exonuclease, partial [Solirubrobacterales bacterium]|nr:3'-5' exonuclease [Solirubrobacterales bacterium]